jgi:Winged helix DNA-binding domain
MVVTRRLHRHRLRGAPYESPQAVVGAFGATQAQEFVPAKWAAAQRAGADQAAVDTAFADGTILRTHVVRQTWHFVRPTDLGWLLDLTGPRVTSSTPTTASSACGPATVKDFSGWSSLTVADCRRGLDLVGSRSRRKWWVIGPTGRCPGLVGHRRLRRS